MSIHLVSEKKAVAIAKEYRTFKSLMIAYIEKGKWNKLNTKVEKGRGGNLNKNEILDDWLLGCLYVFLEDTEKERESMLEKI